MSSTKELIERFYYRGWNKRDDAVILQSLHEDLKFRGSFSNKKEKGAAAYLKYMKKVQSVVSNYTIKLDDMVIGADGKAAVRCTSRGIHKGTFFGVEASGYEVFWVNMAFLTIVDNKITEIWVLGDVDSLKHQIGADQNAVAFQPQQSL